MSKSVTKVVYKPDPQSTDEYTVIVNPAEFKKWKAGGETVPLADVVDSFKVFHSNQGSQGHLRRPSNQQLENLLGTSKDIEVVTKLLEMGTERTGEGFTGGGGTSNMNASRGSADNKGKGSSGI